MVRLFDKDKDYVTIAKWWIDHDQIPYPINLLPNIGFIADELVVGFLYQTDSNVCFIESVVSKKDSNKEERQAALDKLATALIEAAKEMKYKKVIFHTQYPTLKERSMDCWGFENCDGSIERFQRSL